MKPRLQRYQLAAFAAAVSLLCCCGTARAGATATGAVTALAFSPDGRTLAVGRRHTVTLMDPSTGRTVRILTGADGAVTSIAFSPNGSTVAAASGEVGKAGQIAVWNLSSGTRVRSVAAHNDLIYGISLRPDDRQLAAVSYDHQISLWSLASGIAGVLPSVRPRFLRDHTDSIYGVAYSPNGRQLATAAADRTIKVWEPNTGRRLYTLSESTAEQYCVAYRPNGAQVAAGGADKTLRVWNLDEHGGTLVRSGFAHDGAIIRVVYAHNGRSLFTCGEDSMVKEWDADTLAELATYPRQSDWPQSLAISPNDRILAVGCQNGSLTLYDTTTHAPFRGRTIALSPRPPTAASAVGSRSRSRRHTALYGGAAHHQDASTPNRIPVVLGRHRFAACDSAPAGDAEVKQAAGNESISSAQSIPVPSVVTGVLWNGKPTAAAPNHFYRFVARKGEPLTLEVLARRSGSALDSELEILDTNGKPVERAVIRAVAQTEITLSDRDSVSPGIRLLLRPDFGMGDYVLAGRELVQIYTLPKGPDDDYIFRSYRGQRSGFLGTTPEYHTIGGSVYKVQVHPPGSTFSPNGMPLTHLYYRNDDGGPLYGRDSYLEFTPPADAEYIVRLRDVRGQQGEKFTYKLAIHTPRPDFQIALSPVAIGVPKDGAMVASIECERHEGFDGDIAVRLEGLPTGFTATPAVIEPGETGASLRIGVTPGTANPSADSPSTYRVVATAMVGGREVTHTIEPDAKARRVSIGAVSNLQVVTNVVEAALRPGGETVVEARITRLNGFKGRVPLEIRNLPYGVKVDDIGLNGVLITEQETSRKFVIRCEPWVKPQSRLFYVVANVEGGVSNVAAPLTLHITGSAAVSRR